MSKNHFSFEAECIPGDRCFLKDNLDRWSEGICRGANVSVESKESVNIHYVAIFGNDPDRESFYDLPFRKGDVANRDAFLEWQSRLTDAAKDQFRYKGDIEQMFGPKSYSNWIPFYIEGYSVNNAYMAGMGLVDINSNDK